MQSMDAAVAAGQAEQFRIHYLRVTNTADAPFTDRYDGIPIQLAPGQSDNFQLDMAAHIFGYHHGASPEQMCRHVCKRQGWNTLVHLERDETGKTLAERLFAKIKIEPVIYRLVEDKVDTEKPIPADPQPPMLGDDELPPLRAGGKVSHRVGAA